MEQLQDIVSDEWDKVDADLMRKLAHSMPQRCQAVILSMHKDGIQSTEATSFFQMSS